MESVFEIKTKKSIRERIDSIQKTSERKWGQMDITQMLCHVSDALRDALGERESHSSVPFFFKPFVKRQILKDKRFKQGEQTLKTFRQTSGGKGTRPTSFENDKRTLLELYDRFTQTPSNQEFRPHAAAGRLSREEHGKLAWKHLDHHLRQFSA